ncbi:MAG: FAD-dependent oxidoreductase, partial [Planctomycetota bacterium]
MVLTAGEDSPEEGTFLEGDVTYDVVVVGLGAMGSAALYQLARRGARVLGVDQFSPPHSRGSSHGETRLTRVAIGEGRHYVPLAARSHEIWRELERDTGRDLLTPCGGLFFAGERQVSPVHGASDFIEETIAAAQAFDIEHEVLSGEDIG